MKVPKAKKLPSGSWFIQLRLDGVSIPVTAATEKECVQQATLLKAQHQAGRPSKRPVDITLRQAIDKYIKKRKNVLSPSTVRGYTIIRDNRFQDVMDVPVRSVRDWQAEIDKQSQKYTAKTLKNTWGFIATVIRSVGLDVPDGLTLPQVVSNPRPWLEPDEIPVFTAAVRDKPCESAALLALHSLRVSEIYGLAKHPENIDFKNGGFWVAGAVVPDEHHKFVSKDTNKNETSRRWVPFMMPRIEELLKGGLTLQTENAVYKQINRVCREAGLPEVGFHGLRYSFASLAYHLGWSDREIMDVGGWADYQTMHKIYIRLSQKDRKAAADKMRNYYGG